MGKRVSFVGWSGRMTVTESTSVLVIVGGNKEWHIFYVSKYKRKEAKSGISFGFKQKRLPYVSLVHKHESGSSHTRTSFLQGIYRGWDHEEGEGPWDWWSFSPRSRRPLHVRRTRRCLPPRRRCSESYTGRIHPLRSRTRRRTIQDSSKVTRRTTTGNEELPPSEMSDLVYVDWTRRRIRTPNLIVGIGSKLQVST